MKLIAYAPRHSAVRGGCARPERECVAGHVTVRRSLAYKLGVKAVRCSEVSRGGPRLTFWPSSNIGVKVRD